VLAHDMGAKLAVGPLLVALVAKMLRQIENNGYRENMVLTCQGDQGSMLTSG
jgi:hypothetical protein